MRRTSKPDEFISNSGSPIHILYSAKVDEKGDTTLTEVGYENTDDMIEACRESTDIAVIVAYYNQTGDTTVLNRYIPHYGDFSKLPKTLAEFLQLRIDSKNFFDAMPASVKESFNNNADEFFAQAGDDEWYKKIKPILPISDDPTPVPKGDEE